MFRSRKPNKIHLTAGRILLHATLIWSLHSACAIAANIDVVLDGTQVAPSQSTMGTGEGTITVDRFGWVSGSVTTKGLSGTGGEIREAGKGKNGRVVTVLSKNADTYSVPEGTKLDQGQFVSYLLGNLYVTVETALNPNGEIRGQIVLPLFH